MSISAYIYRHNITFRAQEVLMCFLKAQNLPFLTPEHIFRETTNDPKITPLCIVKCSEAEYLQEASRSGNWICKINIQIETKSNNEPGGDHETRCGCVWDLLITDDSVTLINDFVAENPTIVSDFTAFLIRPQNQTHTVNGNKWVSNLFFELECCGSTLT